jgi:hypothetical protein
MIGQRVLVRSSVKLMKGDKVISEKVTYEKPMEKPVVAPPPPIAKPKTPPPTSPKSEARPEFLEPTPTPMSEAIKKQWRDDMKLSEEAYYSWEASLPSTWEREIERLECERSSYNKKAAWSASDLNRVEEIDEQLKACEEILNRFYDEEDYESE